MKILYILYQYLIGIPIFLLLTVFTAIVTVLTAPWKNSKPVHAIQQFWSKSFFYLLFLNIKVEGLENIHPGQSYVFVSNHQSMADVFAIYGWLPVVFKWIMKQELRHAPFVGPACAAAGHIFIDRSSRLAAKRSIEVAEKTLKDGICVVIFPEGTRTRTGELGRFKRGAFSIAYDLNLPIIPISLSGCYGLWKKGAWYATYTPVKMKIGKPLTKADLPEDQTEAMETVRSIVEQGIEK